MSQQAVSRQDGRILALNETVCIQESDRDNCEWELFDRQNGDAFVVWPSEVGELVALLKSFEKRVSAETAREEPLTHDCRNWSTANDLAGVEKTVYNCRVCDAVYTLDE